MDARAHATLPSRPTVPPYPAEANLPARTSSSPAVVFGRNERLHLSMCAEDVLFSLSNPVSSSAVAGRFGVAGKEDWTPICDAMHLGMFQTELERCIEANGRCGRVHGPWRRRPSDRTPGRKASAS